MFLTRQQGTMQIHITIATNIITLKLSKKMSLIVNLNRLFFHMNFTLNEYCNVHLAFGTARNNVGLMHEYTPCVTPTHSIIIVIRCLDQRFREYRPPLLYLKGPSLSRRLRIRRTMATEEAIIDAVV